MKELKLFSFVFSHNIRLYFSISKNKFFLLNDCIKLIIYLPNFYFYDVINGKFSLLFLNKIVYLNFLKYFNNIYNSLINFFYFKLRLKGLGYRMKRLCSYIYKFFFTRNLFCYFHVPYSIFVKIRKRNFFVLSYNKQKLNDLFHHFLILKKMDFYEKTKSFIVKNKVLFLKKKK